MLAATMMLALVAIAQEPADKWETVVSKEGQFVISFPTKPTSQKSTTQNGPGGRIKVVQVECETPTAAYFVHKITLPTKILKGTEEKQLDMFRDYFATLFNAQVLTEKKVRYEAKPGRDFTLRAKEKATGASGIIRIRMYWFDQTIYALIAVSMENRELPEDAGRFFGSFSIGTTVKAKKGIDEDLKGKEIPGFGTAIDPDGDCKIGVKTKVMTVTVPGTLHDLNADIDKFNAPRILREVDGDFSIEVKIVGEFQPGTQSTSKTSVPYNGAGIFIWRDSDNFIRLERSAIFKGGKVSTFCAFEEREGGSRGAVHNDKLAPGTTYLKLERRGSRIFGFNSKDGKKWTALKPIDTVWPSTVKVGLNAINSGNTPFTVRYEDFHFKAKTPQQP